MLSQIQVHMVLYKKVSVRMYHKYQMVKGYYRDNPLLTSCWPQAF
jgi:hypothetical protein